jgi:hypothetical protein
LRRQKKGASHQIWEDDDVQPKTSRFAKDGGPGRGKQHNALWARKGGQALVDNSQADARIKRACAPFLNGHTRRRVMTICPIALAVGCKRCPAFSVCPLKTVIGDYMKPGKPGSKQPSDPAKK